MNQSEVRQMFIHNYPGIRRIGMKGYWYRCAKCGKWCGRPGGEHANIPDNSKMEVDHIQSWAHGGSDQLWNLQALCKPCNRRKSSNEGFRDNIKIMKNNIVHPLDSTLGIARKAVRKTGLQKRK